MRIYKTVISCGNVDNINDTLYKRYEKKSYLNVKVRRLIIPERIDEGFFTWCRITDKKINNFLRKEDTIKNIRKTYVSDHQYWF